MVDILLVLGIVPTRKELEMNLTIKKKIVESIGYELLEQFDICRTDMNYRDQATIHLMNFSRQRIDELRRCFENSKVHGTGVLIKDIDRWLKTCDGDDSVKPRSCSQFCDFLTKMMVGMSGHRLYSRLDSGRVLCYYVNRITYNPPVRQRDSNVPAHTDVELLNKEFGKVDRNIVTFWESDCRGMSIPEALSTKSFYFENEELREDYLKEFERFAEIQPMVGEQFTARGIGTDDCDGNVENRGWFSSRKNAIELAPNGIESKCVIDVFYEDEKDDRKASRNKERVDTWFWPRKKKNSLDTGMVDDFGDEGEDDQPIEVPTHPYLAIFHLSKHLRLRCHVSGLTRYEYDTSIADKLVVPDDLRSLVKMLIEHKDGGYSDIVAGKSGGAVVLLSGPPGVGKTLTAEVYSESEQRPLYSVQCSQLGTDPNDLEDELLKVFTRARRWNAIMLLDEADVYVRERVDDLDQNAIVGVFLRVLEYQDAVLFMTTNRPDSVDDAIASRCIARITYGMPTEDEQQRIWRILCDVSDTQISDNTITEIIAQGNLSGRDIKNLIKLARLMDPGKPISAKTVSFVKKFRPSGANRGG